MVATSSSSDADAGFASEDAATAAEGLKEADHFGEPDAEDDTWQADGDGYVDATISLAMGVTDVPSLSVWICVCHIRIMAEVFVLVLELSALPACWTCA